MTAIAWLALWTWPVVGIILFWRFSLPVALCATLLGGYLLLPSGIGVDFPVLPTLSKNTIPSLTALFLTAIALAKPGQHVPVVAGWLPRHPVLLGFMVILVVSVFATALTNQDTLVFGGRRISGLRIYDGFSEALRTTTIFLPLILARRVLGSREGQRILLFGIMISAIIYTIPALYEVRMSPQLHRQLYGFTATSFLQQMRSGGFRPVVFLNHGLSVGIYLAFSVIAAAALFKMTQGPTRWRYGYAAIWLTIVLILAKSLGALAITFIILSVLFVFKPRGQLLFAASVAAIVLTYPMLRTAKLVPIDTIVSVTESINADRAQSLNVRLYNENILLDKVQQRPVFGWGSWGRNRVYDEQGRDITITDGAWIIELGTGGWLRYLPFFGFMCWPIIGLLFTHREKIDPVCAALALILSAKLLDLIPNSGFPDVVLMLAGSLLGRLEMKIEDVRAQTGGQQAIDPHLDVACAGKTDKDAAHAVLGREQTPIYARSDLQDQADAAAQASKQPTPKPVEQHPYTRTKSQTRYRR